MLELAKKVVVVLATCSFTGGAVYLGHSVVSSYVNSIVAGQMALDESADPHVSEAQPSKSPAKKSISIDFSGLFK